MGTSIEFLRQLEKLYDAAVAQLDVLRESGSDKDDLMLGHARVGALWDVRSICNSDKFEEALNRWAEVATSAVQTETKVRERMAALGGPRAGLPASSGSQVWRDTIIEVKAMYDATRKPEFPPQGTLLGPLYLNSMLLEIDCQPLIFSVITPQGLRYLGMLSNETETQQTYLYVEISKRRLAEIEATDVNNTFRFPAHDCVWVVTVDLKSGRSDAQSSRPELLESMGFFSHTRTPYVRKV